MGPGSRQGPSWEGLPWNQLSEAGLSLHSISPEAKAVPGAGEPQAGPGPSPLLGGEVKPQGCSRSQPEARGVWPGPAEPPSPSWWGQFGDRSRAPLSPRSGQASLLSGWDDPHLPFPTGHWEARPLYQAPSLGVCPLLKFLGQVFEPRTGLSQILRTGTASSLRPSRPGSARPPPPGPWPPWQPRRC